jgi:hypothetical protein
MTSTYRIRDDEPPNFDHRQTILLELQHIRNGAEHEFYYKTKTISSAQTIVPITLDDLEWAGPIPKSQVYEALNLYMWADTVFDVKTVPHADHPLSWSVTKDAVMTVANYTALYGELRYENAGGQWLKFDELDPTATYTHIIFKAKFNRPSARKRHKFSYNVLLKNDQNQIIDFEIDPDIRNPPVDTE